MGWFGRDADKAIDWTGALLPFPVASRSPEPDVLRERAVRVNADQDIGPQDEFPPGQPSGTHIDK